MDRSLGGLAHALNDWNPCTFLRDRPQTSRHASDADGESVEFISSVDDPKHASYCVDCQALRLFRGIGNGDSGLRFWLHN